MTRRQVAIDVQSIDGLNKIYYLYADQGRERKKEIRGLSSLLEFLGKRKSWQLILQANNTGTRFSVLLETLGYQVTSVPVLNIDCSLDPWRVAKAIWQASTVCGMNTTTVVLRQSEHSRAKCVPGLVVIGQNPSSFWSGARNNHESRREVRTTMHVSISLPVLVPPEPADKSNSRRHSL